MPIQEIQRLWLKSPLATLDKQAAQAALVLCGAERTDPMMMAGRRRVIDAEVADLELNRLLARQNELASQPARTT